MRFRPCIDIHGGKVKQIVGSSLTEENKKENFVSVKDASYYALLYKKYGLTGGHVILLDKAGTPDHDKDIAQAEGALSAYPGGMQIGGGITCDNAERMLDMGASHVIVTSYVFSNGIINYDNLNSLRYLIGKDRLVLDLSCRRCGDDYYVVTDRWQVFTKEKLDTELLLQLSDYCDEFLVHAVDVEGFAGGIEEDAAKILGTYSKSNNDDSGKNRITYAGGIASYDDIARIETLSEGRLDFTIGSALDIFGGGLSFEKIAIKYN